MWILRLSSLTAQEGSRIESTKIDSRWSICLAQESRPSLRWIKEPDQSATCRRLSRRLRKHRRPRPSRILADARATRDRPPRLVAGADVRNSPLFARAQIRFLSDRLIDLESQRSRLTAAHSFADGCENEARSCLLLRTRTIAEIYELSDRSAFLGRNRPRHLRRMAEGYPAGRRSFTVLARSVLPVDVLVLRLPHVGRSP